LFYFGISDREGRFELLYALISLGHLSRFRLKFRLPHCSMLLSGFAIDGTAV
jgi:hypothetical protein